VFVLLGTNLVDRKQRDGGFLRDGRILMRADPERSIPSEYGMPVEVFSTCPQSSAVEKVPYKQRIADVARWSEQFGYTGILVYTDNSQVDPWLVSQIILQQTESLCPLLAVQAIYSHPCTV